MTFSFPTPRPLTTYTPVSGRATIEKKYDLCVAISKAKSTLSIGDGLDKNNIKTKASQIRNEKTRGALTVQFS